ncbi:ATP-binding protein [Dokdonella sp.]|uniref:hybrid sensor histidine kinase/response regulator n=1 Tax=Dokdonella sp. TaxID=2291710 RepID=UPI003528096A
MRRHAQRIAQQSQRRRIGGPAWLIVFLAFLALALGLGLVFLPHLPVAALSGALVVVSALIAVTALVGLRAPDSARDAGASGASGQPASSRPAPAMLEELEALRAMQHDLVAAKQQAEAATMAKGEFLATMSHEIRTPLNGIVPLLDLLRSTPLRPDQQEYLATAHQSSLELLRIVDDILDFSKLEASKLELEDVGVNLKEVVDSVATLMEGSATAKGLRLGVVIDPAVRLAVRGDPIRLRQVLTNLVSNAIKFTERGSVTIQVSKRAETRSHHEVTFAVRDTGIGISEAAKQKLFRPFSQADASTTRVFGGTGLGLVICRRLVDLMEGKIGVRSEVGRGSVFWFNVPLRKAIGDVRSRSDLAGVRALLLSGEDAFLRRAGSLVAQLGMSHMHSNLAVDALSKLRANSSKGERWIYEVLIIDVASVGAPTVALIRNIRRDPSLDSLCILIAGSNEEVQDLRSDDRLTALSANFDERELRETLGRLLGVGHGEEPREAPLFGQTSEIDEAQAPAQAVPQLQGRALLVEDNPVNAQVAARLLSLLGLESEVASDGQAALDKLAHGHYDIVLMDCQMPVMDGYTATRTRRTEERARNLPRLPIIAMTANAMAGDREKCIEAGMDDYLTKPLDRHLLASTLGEWLPRSSDPGAKPKQPAPAQKMAPPVRAVAAEPKAPLARQAPAIDQAVVQELLEVMGDGFAGLLQIYLEDTPRLLSRLREASDMTDHDAIAEITHTLKSSSANLGALPLAELARNAEANARAKNSDELGSLPHRVENEFQRVVSAFDELGLR